MNDLYREAKLRKCSVGKCEFFSRKTLFGKIDIQLNFK